MNMLLQKTFLAGVAITAITLATTTCHAHSGEHLTGYHQQDGQDHNEFFVPNNEQTEGKNAVRPRVLPLDSKPFGQSYGDWAADFVRWLYSIPAARNPIFNSENTNCTQPQHGKVWFLGTANTLASCEIPKGKAVLLQLGSYVDTYPCPDPTFVPSAGQTLEAFLTVDAKFWLDTLTPVPNNLRIDGKLIIGDPQKQEVTSGLFNLTGDLSLLKYDGCITGTSQQAVVDGYWAMIVGLRPGLHKFEFILNGKVKNTMNVKVED